MDHDTEYFPDFVTNKRVIADVECYECDYNLRGLDIYHQCPECSADVYRSVEAAARNIKITRPLDHKWRLSCIALVGSGLLVLIGFYLALWISDLELHDLRPTAIKSAHGSTASSISKAGHTLASALFLISVLGGLYCLGITAAAIARQDRKALLVAGSGAVVAILCTVLAMRIGFAIAGL